MAEVVSSPRFVFGVTLNPSSSKMLVHSNNYDSVEEFEVLVARWQKNQNQCPVEFGDNR